MKHLIIIGVGVLSDIIYEYALKSYSYSKEWIFKGYLYGDKDSQKDIEKKNPLAHYEEYDVQADDVFICSYFDNKNREEVSQTMKNKGAIFVNIIHPSANIFSNVEMGVGNILGAFTTISSNVTIGNMNVIQDHCNIGHDTIIGECNHLFVNTILSGNNKVANGASVFTGSIVYPGIKIGNSSIVSAGSVVMRHVKDGMTVMGNPAKIVE